MSGTAGGAGGLWGGGGGAGCLGLLAVGGGVCGERAGGRGLHAWVRWESGGLWGRGAGGQLPGSAGRMVSGLEWDLGGYERRGGVLTLH